MMMDEIAELMTVLYYKKGKRELCRNIYLCHYRIKVESGLWTKVIETSPAWPGPASRHSAVIGVLFFSVTRHRDVIRSPHRECVVIGQIMECKGNIHYLR